MGFAYYVLPDGREAGYGAEAECDRDNCATVIDRGLGWLCGNLPDGHRDPDEPGCGGYFCAVHENDHDCAHPQCDALDDDGKEFCVLAAGHDPDSHSFDDLPE